MADQERIYDPAVADGRFQIEILALRWALIGLYALFASVGVISVSPVWFTISEGFLVAYHVYYTWYTWHELKRGPLPAATAYATPFLDTVAVTLALIAIGDPRHPIWAVYFFIVVGVAFFYYPIARYHALWLMASYAAVGVGLQLRGLDVPVPHMVVAAIILVLAVINLAAYTGGERRLRGRITEAARTDPLTNLRNRRGLEEVLGQRLRSAVEEGKGLALLMVDIDRFKRYNDQFGHLAADAVLEQLAEVLEASVRESELVGRYGGDEFVVIIPDVAPGDATRLAERLRQQVARLGICTVSIGVSTCQDAAASGTVLLDLADAALLAAKQAGRNCVKTTIAEIERAA
jgi:diguanylate cyclase (GGDEF)-like protein